MPSRLQKQRDAAAAAQAKAASYAQDVAEVEGLYQQRLAGGMSKQEALTTAYTGDELRQKKYGISPGQYVVKESDNVATIAASLNSTPDAVLAANPGVAQIQTGMVLKGPGSSGQFTNAEYRSQSQGFAPTTTSQFSNPTAPPGSQFTNAEYRSQTSNTPVVNNQVDPRTGKTRGVGAPASAFVNNKPSPFGNNQGGANPLQPNRPNAFGNNQGGVNPLQPSGNSTGTVTPPGAAPWTPAPGYIDPRSNSGESFLQRNPEVRIALQNIVNQIGPNGRYPTERELEQLKAHGWVTPLGGVQPTPAYVHAAKAKKKASGGGGGGGGGGGVPKVTASRVQQPQGLPAFSGGSGFRGLVNWRI